MHRNGDSCNHNCFIRSYSLPLSSFHVWNKTGPKPAKGSDNIPGEKREDLKSVPNNSLYTAGSIFQETGVEAGIVTMAQRATVFRKNAQTKICVPPKQ